MKTDLEIIDYDIEGAAFRDGDGKGPIVDGAYLTSTVKRRPSGVLGEKPGDAVRLRIDLAALDPKVKADGLARFDALESWVKSVSTDHFVAQAASPAALDAKIAAAEAAGKARDEADEARTQKLAELAAMQAALDALTAQHEAMTAAVAAIEAPAK